MPLGLNVITIRYRCGHDVAHRYETGHDLNTIRRWSLGSCDACSWRARTAENVVQENTK